MPPLRPARIRIRNSQEPAASSYVRFRFEDTSKCLISVQFGSDISVADKRRQMTACLYHHRSDSFQERSRGSLSAGLLPPQAPEKSQLNNLHRPFCPVVTAAGTWELLAHARCLARAGALSEDSQRPPVASRVRIGEDAVESRMIRSQVSACRTHADRRKITRSSHIYSSRSQFLAVRTLLRPDAGFGAKPAS
jgi:hypothetical protein